MAPTKIMLIRHAEKPNEKTNVLGIDEAGIPNPNQLSVRGWQRAGALVRFFTPMHDARAHGIATPDPNSVSCMPSEIREAEIGRVLTAL